MQVFPSGKEDNETMVRKRFEHFQINMMQFVTFTLC